MQISYFFPKPIACPEMCVSVALASDVAMHVFCFRSYELLLLSAWLVHSIDISKFSSSVLILDCRIYAFKVSA